uniref:Putative transcription factor TFIIB zinc-binding motif n=1 Tax=viral metagenome TaxID=1070528 RepID=A0A6M3LKP6_9ZZZZ
MTTDDLQKIVDWANGVAKRLESLRPYTEHDEFRCEKCGAVYTHLDFIDDKFWEQNPEGGAFAAASGNPDAPSVDQVCPDCGARNSFEEIDDETDEVDDA